MKDVAHVVLLTIGGLLLVFLLAFGWRLAASLFNPPPLMMTADDVDGDWPFRGDAVQVSCCSGGDVGILVASQWFAFAGGRGVDRFPVTRLGFEDLTLDDFLPAHRAARRLARERWPDERIRDDEHGYRRVGSTTP